MDVGTHRRIHVTAWLHASKWLFRRVWLGTLRFEDVFVHPPPPPPQHVILLISCCSPVEGVNQQNQPCVAAVKSRTGLSYSSSLRATMLHRWNFSVEFSDFKLITLVFVTKIFMMSNKLTNSAVFFFCFGFIGFFWKHSLYIWLRLAQCACVQHSCPCSLF